MLWHRNRLRDGFVLMLPNSSRSDSKTFRPGCDVFALV
jgi:hypothetical protein